MHSFVHHKALLYAFCIHFLVGFVTGNTVQFAGYYVCSYASSDRGDALITLQEGVLALSSATRGTQCKGRLLGVLLVNGHKSQQVGTLSWDQLLCALIHRCINEIHWCPAFFPTCRQCRRRHASQTYVGV